MLKLTYIEAARYSKGGEESVNERLDRSQVKVKVKLDRFTERRKEKGNRRGGTNKLLPWGTRRPTSYYRRQTDRQTDRQK